MDLKTTFNENEETLVESGLCPNDREFTCHNLIFKHALVKKCKNKSDFCFAQGER